MMKKILFLYIVLYPLFVHAEEKLSYVDIIKSHCSPPFYYYKSWCYYIFPNVTLDWPSASRLCHSMGRNTHLAYISGDDEMIDPLRDILINREKSQNIKSIWTNTTWGQQRRTILSRYSKRLCRKLELAQHVRYGEIDTLRMPFTNCREKHMVMCRKELPSNVICRRPWALAYGICYYFDEKLRTSKIEDEQRNIVQCQAWNGQVFSSSQQEKNILIPFLSYSLHSLRSSRILPENFGGISYTFQNVIQDKCSLVSGDVYLSSALTQLKNQTSPRNCSSYNSYTFCRQPQNTTCEPPWFYDDGFCLYFSPQTNYDMSGGMIECSKNGGHLLYINNEQELFRLTHNLLHLSPFFKHLSLAGVWLAVSYRASSASFGSMNGKFDWLWDMSIESYLDDNWKRYEWKQYFQHRLAPYVVSAGDCASLIIDSKIREPIERTSCHHRRTVVCRKPLDDERKSFHKKSHYERVQRLKTSTVTVEDQQQSKVQNKSLSLLTITRHVFDLFNGSTHRLIVHFNGSVTSSTTTVVFACKAKGILFEKSIQSDEISSVMAFDILLNTIENEYKVLFNYLHSSNCSTNDTATNQCVDLSCVENDPWHFMLPEVRSRLNTLRNQSTTNDRCLAKYNNSNFEAQICSLLIDQFRITEENQLMVLTPSTTNDCADFGGQCVPDSLIMPTSVQFIDTTLNCSLGFICWLQGERCGVNAYCIDRIRFPCPVASHLTNGTCSNSHHDCCASSTASKDSSVIISTKFDHQTWNIFLPVYYFSFHGTSKWDKFFFNSWLHMGSDLSHDFVNDEFLFSCTAIIIEPTLLLTHESCLPTRLASSDKRSILFTLTKTKDEDNEFDKVPLHIETYNIYSPFQLVRLAFNHDFLVNKTTKRFNDVKLNKDKIDELFCVLVLNEFDTRQVRLINDFERSFVFYDNTSLFTFVNSSKDNNDLDEEWSFAPIVCVTHDKQHDWTVVGISGLQLKHRCKILNRLKYCQMTFVYSSTWFDNY